MCVVLAFAMLVRNEASDVTWADRVENNVLILGIGERKKEVVRWALTVLKNPRRVWTF